jgi:hypothetical protein
MKLISCLMIICLAGMILSQGCSDARSPYQEDIYVVSKDPIACRSMNIDCSGYNSMKVRFVPYSNSTGCGCKATF